MTLSADSRPTLKPSFRSQAAKTRKEASRVDYSQSVVAASSHRIEGGV